MILYDRDRLPDGFEAPQSRVICVPASEMADRLGAVKVANVVMLGALLEETGILPAAGALEVLEETITRPELLELDRRAMSAGIDFVREKVKAAAV